VDRHYEAIQAIDKAIKLDPNMRGLENEGVALNALERSQKPMPPWLRN
jgi:hypothetical protein